MLVIIMSNVCLYTYFCVDYFVTQQHYHAEAAEMSFGGLYFATQGRRLHFPNAGDVTDLNWSLFYCTAINGIWPLHSHITGCAFSIVQNT